MNMKPIQVLFDEPLLRRLDADEEVRKSGRSAVLRRAAAEYLRKRRVRTTAEAYRRAYTKNRNPGDELRGWPDEGAWPET
jgi:metal-responsive CopG/Arc/MetJ family transcriptional regulator